MFILTPNYDYESQTDECKAALNRQDFHEICNLFKFKEELKRERNKNKK